ncbi:MAG: hypothetical protein QOG68_2230, partial [Solirubrobacteraceae bacterium]|nr:hypothetical protein [Solirubrobacteraceae bacterium]
MLVCAATAVAAPHPHAPARYSHGEASPALSGLVGAMGANAADAADARYAYLRKIDSHLQNVAATRLDGGNVATRAAGEAVTLSDGNRRALVDVYVIGDMADAKDALRAQGLDVTAVS